MKKLKRFIDENKWIMLTFLISTILISIIYTIKKIAPFGNNSMLCVDFYHQYGPLLNELYDRLRQGEGLLYSFNTGLGIPFFRNYLNYLSSIFNIVMFLFKKDNIVMSYSVIIGLKVAASSCTMAYFLKKTFKKNDILICIFGLFYSFSGYFCAYYWNIMWLDGMVFLPIITLGINKLVNEEKPLLYIISLSIMLFSNYFIGYMICIYSVFYFLGYIFYKGNYKIKNISKKIMVFLISSLLAAGLVAFALLPLYYSLSSISATNGTFPSYSINFNVVNYLFNHISFVNRTVFASDVMPLPNVTCGMLNLVLILVLFTNKKINLKVKLIAILTLSFFCLSFNINIFDYVWHAFHVPNDLPYRYSFIYIFSLVVIGYYSLIKLNKNDYYKISISFMIIFIFTMLASKFEFKNLSDDRIIVVLIILSLYYLLYLLLNVKKIPNIFLKLSLLGIACFECVYGITYNWDINHDLKTFMYDKKYYEEFVNYLKEKDNDLYRVEKTDMLTLNDGAWYDYKGVSTFSSMAYEQVSKVQRKLGLAGNDINSYYYKKASTPIYNTMFDIKYLFGEYINDDYYRVIYTNKYNLNEYLYPSSFVYMVKKEVKNINLIEYEPFINQENFVLLSTGVNNVFTKLDIADTKGGTIFENEGFNNEYTYDLYDDSSTLTLSINNPDKESIYLYIKCDCSSFEVDDDYYGITSDEYYVVNIGRQDKELVDVKINFDEIKSGSLKFYAYTINDDAFKSFYKSIKDGSLKVKRYSDTLIEGTINASKNQIAFTSLAYDSGYTVYVDGKKIKTYKLMDAYLGFDVKEGTHKIKIVYYPYKLKEGLIISMISVIIILLCILKENKTILKKR